MHMLQAGRQTDKHMDMDRVAGIPLAAEKGEEQKQQRTYEVIKQAELPRRKWFPCSESDALHSPATLTATGSDT